MSTSTSLSLPRLAGLAAALFAAFPAVARANGAFPDSGQLMLPAGRPQEIGIGTNFGLILTDDGGATWSWVCETTNTSYGTLYQLGIEGRMLAISQEGLVYSDDGACGWSRSGGALAEAVARDVFVDKTDPRRVLAVATTTDRRMTVHRSTDGGTTFGDALFTGEVDEVFTGIESARSNPDVIYVVSYVGLPGNPKLRVARSADAGATWRVTPLPDEFAAVARRWWRRRAGRGRCRDCRVCSRPGTGMSPSRPPPASDTSV